MRYLSSMVGGLAMLLWGCNPSAVPLGSVEAAVDHAAAERLALTPVSVPEMRGEASLASGEQMWVVPVADVGGTVSSEVHLWVAPGEPQPADADPQIWAARLRDRFDRRARTHPVIARESDEAGSPVVRAIRDAERRHGLRSAPGAPVLGFPD